MCLNCKVIKKVATPLPPPPPPLFQVYPPFLAKNFVAPSPQVTQFLEGPMAPSFLFFSTLNFKILFLWLDVVLRFKALDNEANNNSCVVKIHQ